MARADQIVELVASGIQKDTDRVRKVAHAIASDARAKNHGLMAGRIERALESGARTGAVAVSRVGAVPGITHRCATRPLSSLFLSDSVQTACEDLILEQQQAESLRAEGVDPRHRVLLFGPPGNGKTSLAECLAHELQLPFITVAYDAIVTSYLGDTSRRLRKLFDSVRSDPCVLFFDEFDAVGKERGDVHETGEIKRVVTTLLMQMDQLSSMCIFVAATNHEELLDRASWRRFEVTLKLNPPTDEQLRLYFARGLVGVGGMSMNTIDMILSRSTPTCFAEAEDIVLDLRRHSILTRDHMPLNELIDARLNARNPTTINDSSS